MANCRKSSKTGTFKATVERSSFGTPAARKVRSYTNEVTASRIIKRSQTVGRAATSRKSRE